MEKTFILYGLAKDETRDYMESLITETTDEAHLEKARAWAIKNGFHALRVSEFTEDGKLPNFINALNI